MSLVVVLAGVALALVFGRSLASGGAGPGGKIECDANAAVCAETASPVGYRGAYTGHDEPSLIFYSDRAGAGNSMSYNLTLPSDPSTQPAQDGSGGVFNFELRSTFWLGMAMCDDQSSPNPGGSPVGPNVPCTPDSDSNIYNSSDPASAQYIGHHPGTAFTELQFYPPGWFPWPAGISCDATRWCAALNIDSFSENDNTGQQLNPACQKITGGPEYVNFAFVTKDGTPQAPPNPVQATGATFTPDPSKDLFMNSGDRLVVDLHDSPNGLVVTIDDLSTGHSGTMTASAANGFGGVKFAPTGRSCVNVPYNFHPMYSTSSPDTRVPWTAHSYNIAFSDEIGHFELCGKAAPGSATCAQAGAGESAKDGDDNLCFDASLSTQVPLTACEDTDFDFDGIAYQHSWPGTIANPTSDAAVHPTSVLFSSPLTGGQSYDQVGFEADMPRIEDQTSPPCQRHLSNPADPSPGSGCVNPPVGASFYPIYTTSGTGSACLWQIGGTNIPGTTNTFGGDTISEFGTTLFPLAYPAPGGNPQFIYEDFRTIRANPC
jgi:hypothetical protein